MNDTTASSGYMRQPSPEEAELHRATNLENGHPASPMIAKPTLKFASIKEGIAYRRRVTMTPQIDPNLDPTIHRVMHSWDYYVTAMFQAMYNLEDVHDDPGSQECRIFGWGEGGKADPVDVEAACCNMFDIVIDRCTSGFRGKPKDNKSLKPAKGKGHEADRDSNCVTRMENVIKAIRTSKCVARDVLYEDTRLIQLANAPLEYLHRKHCHHKNNGTKKKSIEKGKDARATLNAIKAGAANNVSKQQDVKGAKLTFPNGDQLPGATVQAETNGLMYHPQVSGCNTFPPNGVLPTQATAPTDFQKNEKFSGHKRLLRISPQPRTEVTRGLSAPSNRVSQNVDLPRQLHPTLRAAQYDNHFSGPITMSPYARNENSSTNMSINFGNHPESSMQQDGFCSPRQYFPLPLDHMRALPTGYVPRSLHHKPASPNGQLLPPPTSVASVSFPKNHAAPYAPGNKVAGMKRRSSTEYNEETGARPPSPKRRKMMKSRRGSGNDEAPLSHPE